jgi:FkbM family methyltransferase
VIDVGAFVGDIAMYFILKGAGRVIAIEPLPANYEELLDNIHLNGIEGRIIPINAMVSSRRMIVEIPTNVPIYIRGGSIGEFRRHGAGSYVNIESITISDIIDKFGIAVIKMDCEGCEFDVILNDYDHVRLFREFIFEYHSYAVNKPVDDLLNVLGRDYKCDIRGDEDLGIMHCIRK